MSKPKCKLCGAQHWTYEPHVLPKTVTQPETVTPLPISSLPETVTQTVTPTETVTLSAGGRGKRLYASNAQRQAAYRARTIPHV